MPLLGMEGGGQFLDQQPDQDDIDRELVMFAVRSFAHGGFHSPAAAAAPAAMSTEYYYALGLAGGQASSVRAADHRPFPVQAPPPPAVAASEAAIAALVAAEAPADDCCAVCLQDGAAPAAWSRVAPCGHRFHAACVEKWLRVKPSCPVCRRPAAPSPPAAVPGAMN